MVECFVFCLQHVVNIYMTPDKIGNPFGMQLTYKQKDDHIRNIYLHAEDGKTASGKNEISALFLTQYLLTFLRESFLFRTSYMFFAHSNCKVY